LGLVLDAAQTLNDRPLQQAVMGSPLVGVLLGGQGAASVGIASRVDRSCGLTLHQSLPDSALELAGWLTNPPPGTPSGRSLGMAAVNALVPPPDTTVNVKGQNLILNKGRGVRVAVVGHFPFVERLGAEFAALDVLELSPRPGDLPANRAAEVLPLADVVAITGTTLLNGTLAGLLALCRPSAFVIILGPSTPLVPALFDCGIDALAGAVAEDLDRVLEGVHKDLSFKHIHGMRAVTLAK